MRHGMHMQRTTKALRFWPFLLGLVLADCSTKRLAVEHLTPAYRPHEVVGEMVRLTLAYNPGAAMSLSLGAYSRIGFSLIALLALGVLGWLYRATPVGERWRPVGLALLAGGAFGNLLDRLVSPRGVVDFIDVGVGGARFWTFNLADVGITLGCCILAACLLKEDAAPARAAAAALPRTAGAKPRPSLS
jgi:signal peptidase II